MLGIEVFKILFIYYFTRCSSRCSVDGNISKIMPSNTIMHMINYNSMMVSSHMTWYANKINA